MATRSALHSMWLVVLLSLFVSPSFQAPYVSPWYTETITHSDDGYQMTSECKLSIYFFLSPSFASFTCPLVYSFYSTLLLFYYAVRLLNPYTLMLLCSSLPLFLHLLSFFYYSTFFSQYKLNWVD